MPVDEALGRIAQLAARVLRLERLVQPLYYDWTPTIWQNGDQKTVTITEAKYCLIGKVAHVQVDLSITEAGAAATILMGGQPAAIQPALVGDDQPIGVCRVYKSSAVAATFFGLVTAQTATQFAFVDTTNNTYIGSTFATANGDVVQLSASYRVA